MSEILKRMNLQQTNRPCDCILHWHREGWMWLDAPYQRGDVWGPIRQRNLIRSLIIGIPIPSIIINDRFATDSSNPYSAVVIDGKQRITAILKFLLGDLSVPGEWFGMKGEIMIHDLPENFRRRIHNTPIAFSEGRLANEEEERQVFELVNFGGVPQGESDFTPTPAPTNK